MARVAPRGTLLASSSASARQVTNPSVKVSGSLEAASDAKESVFAGWVRS